MCVCGGGGGGLTEQFTRDLQRLCSCSELLICAFVNEGTTPPSYEGINAFCKCANHFSVAALPI